MTTSVSSSKYPDWMGPDSSVSEMVVQQSDRCLESYAANPALIEEHANIERSVTQGGYGRRQLYELIQNGADELQTDPGGGIEVVLTANALYCANLGTPISREGAETILSSHLSRKRGTEIGRFGLGFKSVLSISHRPQVFSRTGSFGWDSAESHRRIFDRTGYDGPMPILRVAHVLDHAAARSEDPVLNELMDSAITVIRLPLIDGHSDRVAQDIRDFPATFAIFSPHVGSVILEDRRIPDKTARREIYVRGGGVHRTLFTDDETGERTSEWMLFETVHTPSAEARQDAGEYHDRTEIPLAWAVPVSGQAGVGRFWAFFPTNYETTLRGVLNAPWKTNEDRQNLLENNKFNEELMQVAAKLVVDSFPELSTKEDPGRHLTLMTARGREARNWADQNLTGLVYDYASYNLSIPNQSGQLCRPHDIRLHPPNLERAWLDKWTAYPNRPEDWCHHSIEETVRRSRAETILERAAKGPSSARVWLESLVASGTADASIAALSIASDMVRRNHRYAVEIREAKILRSATGEMVTPVPDTVFTRSSLDAESDHLVYVDSALEADLYTREDLATLGIREADTLGILAAHVQGGVEGFSDTEWDRFWLIARRAGAHRLSDFLQTRDIPARKIKVQARSGEFRSTDECLLPGRVILNDSLADDEFVVDLDFHSEDLGILRAIGMSDIPQVSGDIIGGGWFSGYKQAAVQDYVKTFELSSWRNVERSTIVEGNPTAGPLGLLALLTPEARARFISEIPPEGLTVRWQVYYQNRNGGVYKKTKHSFDSPLVWAIRKHGFVDSSLGLRPVGEVVGPELKEFAQVIPVVSNMDPALRLALKLPDTLDRISGHLWNKLFEAVETHEAPVDVGIFYGMASKVLSSAPRQIRCRRRDGWTLCSPSEVAVASDKFQHEKLTSHDFPVIQAADDVSCLRLVKQWGLKAYSDALITDYRAVPLSDPIPVEDVFPLLRMATGRPAQHFNLIRCDELDELIKTPTGQESFSVDIGIQGNAIYWLERDDDLELVRCLSRELTLGFTEDRCRSIVAHREELRQSNRVVKVRQENAPAAKLLAMLPVDSIRAKIPQAVLEAVAADGSSNDDLMVAQLAVDVYGSAVLREFKSELEEVGFSLPEQMAGGRAARRFTDDLGFPAEFAGIRQPERDAVLVVDGPVAFPKLHDYQALMVQRMCEVLQSRDPLKQRGMLTLPTGAGKTRVAVEAMIRALRDVSDDRMAMPVLWIAQSDELCEQAVQSWKFIWRNTGPAKQLTISRLWKGNEADPIAEGFHLVVATDAKLARVIDTSDYAWLRESRAVIIDEAHTSISPRYTGILTALGLTAYRTRCPLVGLSATPWRGVNDEETRRLINRYGAVRLDHDQNGRSILSEDPYVELQELGVLARIRHELLPGTTVRLSDYELAEMENLPWLPQTAEKRLGMDQVRNHMLVDEIGRLPEDWQILLFATSVDHARTMAALLKRKGIRAEAVSGDMDDGARRHVVEQFRSGEVQVVSNYNVLTQGFDAPATRAVIVARPTFSPNRYLQMIGRGLRGPANGGKEECLIVNVTDNIAHFGENLAFRQFDRLWKHSR